MSRSTIALAGAVALLLALAAGDASAQRESSTGHVAAQIGDTLLVTRTQRPATYNMVPFRSYGRVHVNMTGVAISNQDCTSSPLTNFLSSLLVRRNNSAGLAMRITTSGTGSDAVNADAPSVGTMTALGSDRITLFVANLIKVTKSQSRGSRCRAEVNAVNSYTPLLDLRGAGRSVNVEFLVWTSREHSPGFIPATVIDLYSEKALAVLTRDQLRTYASSLVSMFDNADERMPSRPLNFQEARPDMEYGLSLLLSRDGTMTSGARVDVEMETVSSMFWPGSGDPDFSSVRPATIMSTSLAPGVTLQNEVTRTSTAEYSAWVSVRPTDTDFTNFETGCAAIERRIAELGLIGDDQAIALWAVAAQHSAVRQNPAPFGGTACFRSLRSSLESMQARQPREFQIPAPLPPIQAYPTATQMDLFMRAKFRPFTRTPPDEDRQSQGAGVFTSPSIWVSGRLPATTPPIADQDRLTGVFGRVGCFLYTQWREELNLPGSRVEGVIELGDGSEAYFRGFFPPVPPGEEPRLSRLEFHSEASPRAQSDIRDRHGDQCEILGWRPRMIYGPRN